LYVAERPIPELGSGDVLVRVHAAMVGTGDCKTRAGLLQNFCCVTLPKIPGRYGSGEVAAVGMDAGTIRVGDGIVFATLHTESGSAAECVRVATEKTAPNTKAHKRWLIVPNLVPGMQVKNASRIKHLDGWDKPRTTPQMGRKQRQLV
jgi:NADPH:quinone reductase-like Zn-dependent oxidoreductase